jgi:hypothetical protein
MAAWIFMPTALRAQGYSCPLYPVLTFPNGTLYYCDYFETNQCTDPTNDYIIGDFDWPQTCPDCPSSLRASFRTGGKFLGLKDPISDTDDLVLPKGPARTFSSKAKPPVAYLSFKDVRNLQLYAKVFAFSIDVGRAQGGQSKFMTMLVALQLKEKPGNSEEVTCSPLDGAGVSCAYRCEYQVGGKKHPMLVLTAQ